MSTTTRETVSDRIMRVHFEPYTSRELKQLSVKEITNPTSFDLSQNATYGGLYDPALGMVHISLSSDAMCILNPRPSDLLLYTRTAALYHSFLAAKQSYTFKFYQL